MKRKNVRVIVASEHSEVQYFLRGLVEGEAEVVEFHGSGHLASLLETDGFIVVERGEASLDDGARVPFSPRRLGMRC